MCTQYANIIEEMNTFIFGEDFKKATTTTTAAAAVGALNRRAFEGLSSSCSFYSHVHRVPYIIRNIQTMRAKSSMLKNCANSHKRNTTDTKSFIFTRISFVFFIHNFRKKSQKKITNFLLKIK